MIRSTFLSNTYFRENIKERKMISKSERFNKCLVTLCCLLFSYCLHSQIPDSIKKYSEIIKKHIYSDYKGMFREPKGTLKYPFITPGSDQYANDLWDWDSWWSNVALRQILSDQGVAKDKN